jgi:hypothetical protein
VLARTQIAAAYTSDLAVQALCASLLLLAALFQLSDATQVATSCAIRGYKVTRQPMQIQLVAFWGFALPLGCWLGLAPEWLPWRPAQPMAAQGFWIALVIGLTVAALLLSWACTGCRCSVRRASRTSHIRGEIRIPDAEGKTVFALDSQHCRLAMAGPLWYRLGFCQPETTPPCASYSAFWPC